MPPGVRHGVPNPDQPEEAVKPTAKQLAYLRVLAQRTGETFVTPRSREQASREIDRLRHRSRSTATERSVERRQISRDMAERPHDATAVHPHEIVGYGSSARWAGTKDAER